MSNQKLYVIYNMFGEFWTGSSWESNYNCYSPKKLSRDAAMVCTKQLTQMGYDCYFDRA